jgi:hypothetical protein
MKLSKLQRFILRKAYLSGRAKVTRQVFFAYYEHLKNAPKPKLQVQIITQSLERLIEKGLVIGYGKKTQEKLFIDFIQLTAKGKKIVKELLSKQTPLPFPKKSKK